MSNIEITAQISRIEELANEERGIADLLCVLDVAVQNCGEIPHLISNISKWIYRHQADLTGTCEAWKKYMNTL